MINFFIVNENNFNLKIEILFTSFKVLLFSNIFLNRNNIKNGRLFYLAMF